MNVQRKAGRTAVIVTVVGWALAAFASHAEAACFEASRPQGRAYAAAPLAMRSHTQSTAGPSAAINSIVGLWRVDFLLGNGPDIYDQMFQQYHEGGTETSLSNGLPPVLGNVCLGIWKATGPRTIAVKHVAWNWTADGILAGTFELDVDVTIEPDGRTFAGSWSAKNFDREGHHLPDLDAAGIVRGARIAIDR